MVSYRIWFEIFFVYSYETLSFPLSSQAFQRFAVRTSKNLENISAKGKFLHKRLTSALNIGTLWRVAILMFSRCAPKLGASKNWLVILFVKCPFAVREAKQELTEQLKDASRDIDVRMGAYVSWRFHCDVSSFSELALTIFVVWFLAAVQEALKRCRWQRLLEMLARIVCDAWLCYL